MSVSQRATTRARSILQHSTQPSIRLLSTCSSSQTSSSSSSRPPPPPSTEQTTRKNKALYRKVVRTAVLGAYESSNPETAPPYSLRSYGFKAPKVRSTPNSSQGKRAKLVEFDAGTVLQNGYSKKSLANPANPRVSGKRGFSTSARSGRASEESLQLDESWLDVEGGDWAGVGEGKGKGNASESSGRGRKPEPGDWVETRRYATSLYAIRTCIVNSD